MKGPMMIARLIVKDFVKHHVSLIVGLFYGDIWKLRALCRRRKKAFGFRYFLYTSYFEQYGAWIGLGADLDPSIVWPHGYFGVFISSSAVIGKNTIIFQQVTIGSNRIGKDNSHVGGPVVGANVCIGVGAKIIGEVRIGDDARIGAGCVVVKDVPANATAVSSGIRIIEHAEPRDNTFVPNDWGASA